MALTDWILVQRLGALAVVAAVTGVPAQVRAVATSGRSGTPIPTSWLVPVLFTAGLGIGAAILGSVLGPRAGLAAPLLAGPVRAADLQPVVSLVGVGVMGGLLGALLIPVYYAVAPRVDPETFRAGEAVRMAMGVPARVAIGGVLEELVFRWGVLALIAWVGMQLTGIAGPVVRWTAILGAALAFGASHLPGAAGLSGRLTLGMVAVSLAVNGWFGIVAGWLVWHRGLAAAMVAHATVHVLWAAFERPGSS